jgi:hypothetical protein
LCILFFFFKGEKFGVVSGKIPSSKKRKIILKVSQIQTV